jgi:glutaminyl-tRNA synthetase
MSEKKETGNFIENIIREDLKNNKNEGRIHTRFPPEPNGYLHIGHAKSICLNFGIAREYNAPCNLRFDDTNPVKEDTEYVDSIMEDIRWLGFQWHDKPYYASDYFDQLYAWALMLIKKGLAYVCDLSAEEIAKYRGTPTQPGMESPYRNRSVEENLRLFEDMKKGKYKDGEKLLRAKIDMSSPNMHMRDPAIYRIKHAHHHRTGNKWCIYPMYDFAHGQSDYIEKITHSLCTLEFEIHRPLYDWFLDHIAESDYRPRQIEFARLNLSYTIMSKRKLLELVEKEYVNNWDDPRMPTISGLRRRGFTPESIRNFIDKVGIAKRENFIDVALLEHALREDLNKKALRMMAVLDPVKLIISNYPENKSQDLHIENNPEDPEMGKRSLIFSRELYIERDDFMENPPKKYFRLSPGNEVRLKGSYIIKCVSFTKDAQGQLTQIHCTYDPETKSGSGMTRKVKGTIHWVNAEDALDAEVRLYDRLFLKEDPEDTEEGKDYTSNINPDSLKIIQAKVESTLANAAVYDKFQFIRLGYFSLDPDSENKRLVFNRIVPLRDTWAKISQKG